MKPYIRKVKFSDIFQKQIYAQIKLYRKISFIFFVISLTPLRVFVPVRYIAYVLIDGDKIVGKAYLVKSGKRAELTVGLGESYRSKGFGAQLVKRLLDENKDKMEIFLRVHKDNRAAQEFFKKHKFRKEYDEMVLGKSK
ncbi:GNAT family N-acetyltransferase [Candidatus Woesearchaeota archaeon]|nr:GNAT family N-acetyltransferase [Candidatus Woesearchaeota archaeon]